MKKRHLIVAIIFIFELGFLNVAVTNNIESSVDFYEEPLEVEDWMTQPFTADDSTYMVEEDLEVEPWMTEIFV